MLRSVKYGLSGAVVAGLVAGTVAFTGSASGEGAPMKTVRLIVDGTPRTVHTKAGLVRGVLAAAGFQPTGHDLVAPAPNSPIGNHATIVLKRGRQLDLDIDGIDRQVWTTEATVAGAMSALGFGSTDFTSVSRSRRLPLSATAITVRTPKFVTVVHDGTTTDVTTTDATVGQLLGDLSLALHNDDTVRPKLSTPLDMGMRIKLTRIDRQPFTKTRLIHYDTRSINDPKLPAGTTKVVRAGINGVKGVRWSLLYVNGKQVGQTKLGVNVLRAPTNQIERVGTKIDPGSPASVQAEQAIAKELLPKFGFGADQLGCLIQMWNHESGWRTNAANPSGAYGIPQALPGSKMSSAGPNWQTDPTTQIKWGLGYIKSRYGTPCGAWGLWQQQGWY